MNSVRKFIAIVVLLALVSGSASAFAGGSGSESDPYQVATCSHVDEMSSTVDGYFEITSDIDCGGQSLNSIMNPSNIVIEGNRKTISNFVISSSSGYKGFIGGTDTTGVSPNIEVYNLIISEADVSCSGFGCGVVVGGHYGSGGATEIVNTTVKNSKVTNDQNNGVAAFVGYNNADTVLRNIKSVDNTITNTDTSYSYYGSAASIVGYASSAAQVQNVLIKDDDLNGQLAGVLTTRSDGDGRINAEDVLIAGSVTVEGGEVGETGASTYTNVYYDQDTTDIQDSNGAATGETTSYLTGTGTVSDLGFDSSIWMDVEDDYPVIEKLYNYPPTIDSTAVDPSSSYYGEHIDVSMNASNPEDEALEATVTVWEGDMKIKDSVKLSSGSNNDFVAEDLFLADSKIEDYTVQYSVEDGSSVAETNITLDTSTEGSGQTQSIDSVSTTPSSNYFGNSIDLEMNSSTADLGTANVWRGDTLIEEDLVLDSGSVHEFVLEDAFPVDNKSVDYTIEYRATDGYQETKTNITLPTKGIPPKEEEVIEDFESNVGSRWNFDGCSVNSGGGAYEGNQFVHCDRGNLASVPSALPSVSEGETFRIYIYRNKVMDELNIGWQCKSDAETYDYEIEQYCQTIRMMNNYNDNVIFTHSYGSRKSDNYVSLGGDYLNDWTYLEVDYGSDRSMSYEYVHAPTGEVIASDSAQLDSSSHSDMMVFYTSDSYSGNDIRFDYVTERLGKPVFKLENFNKTPSTPLVGEELTVSTDTYYGREKDTAVFMDVWENGELVEENVAVEETSTNHYEYSFTPNKAEYTFEYTITDGFYTYSKNQTLDVSEYPAPEVSLIDPEDDVLVRDPVEFEFEPSCVTECTTAELWFSNETFEFRKELGSVTNATTNTISYEFEGEELPRIENLIFDTASDWGGAATDLEVGDVIQPLRSSIGQMYSEYFYQDGNGQTVTIELGGVNIMESPMSQNGDTVEFSESGYYVVSYSSTWRSKNADGRHIMKNWLEKNGNRITPSETRCYIRLQDSSGYGDFCANSATTVVQANSGDQLRLRGTKDHGTTGTTDTVEDQHISVRPVNVPVAQVYDSNGGQNYDSPIKVNMDTETFVNSSEYAFDSSNDQIEVKEDGWYKVYYTVNMHSTGQSDRQSTNSHIKVNGVKPANQLRSTSYIRDTGDGDQNHNTAAGLVKLNAGDKVSLHLEKEYQQSGGASVTLADRNWIGLHKASSESMQVERANSKQNIPGNTWTDINFDTVNKDSRAYSFTEGNSGITIEEDGWYTVSYNFGWDDEATNDRHRAGSRLLKNGNKITPSRQTDYSRGYAGGRLNTNSGTYRVHFNQGDVLKLQGWGYPNYIEVDPEVTYLSISKGLRGESGSFTSDPVKAEKAGNWTLENLEGSGTPDIDYAENSSGSFQWYDNASQLSESQYVKYRFDLHPGESIDRLNLGAEYNKTFEFDLPIDTEWGIKIFQEGGKSALSQKRSFTVQGVDAPHITEINTTPSEGNVNYQDTLDASVSVYEDNDTTSIDTVWAQVEEEDRSIVDYRELTDDNGDGVFDTSDLFTVDEVNVNYTVTVRANNTLGGIKTNETIRIVEDNESPSLTVNDESSTGMLSRDTLLASANSSDNIGLEEVWAEINGTKYTMTQESGDKYTKEADVEDGYYEYTITSEDLGGNTESSNTLTTTLDATPPEITDVKHRESFENDAELYDEEVVTVEATVTDKRLDTVWINASKFGNKSFVEMTKQSGDLYKAEFQVNASQSSPSGEYNITVKANDTMANQRVADSSTVYLISDPAPELFINSPEDGITAGSPFDFQFTPTCYGNGCGSAHLFFNDTETGEINVNETQDWMDGSFEKAYVNENGSVEPGIQIETDRGEFQVSSTGTQTINTGFEPDVVKFYITNTHGDFNDDDQHFRQEHGSGHGYAVKTENGWKNVGTTVASGSDSMNGQAQSNSDSYSIYQVITPDNGDGINGWIEGGVSDTSSDGFTVDMSRVDQNQYVTYQAYEFEENANVDAGFINTPTSAGTQSYDIGFEPNYLAMKTAPQLTSVNDQVQNSYDDGWSHGWAANEGGTIEQLAYGWASYSYGRNDHVVTSSDTDIIRQLRHENKNSAASGELRGSLSQFTDTGFEIDYSTVDSGQTGMYLAVDTQANPDVGYFKSPTSTGEQTVETDTQLSTISFSNLNSINEINIKRDMPDNSHDFSNFGEMFGGGNLDYQNSMSIARHANSENGHVTSSSNEYALDWLYTEQDEIIEGREEAKIVDIGRNSFTLDWNTVETSSSSGVPYDQVLIAYHGFGGHASADSITGKYESKTFSTEDETSWSDSVVNTSEPGSATTEIDFAENSTGNWEWYDTIDQVPRSRYLKFNATLQAENGDKPLLNSLEFAYGMEGEATLENVENDTVNTLTYDFGENPFPESFNWYITVEDEATQRTSSDMRTIHRPETNVTLEEPVDGETDPAPVNFSFSLDCVSGGGCDEANLVIDPDYTAGLQDNWWNQSWSYRKPVTVTENSGENLTEFQVEFSVDYSEEMNNDFSDIRFADEEGEEIPYYIQSKTDGSSASVMVKLAEIPANGEQEIFMYYGNSESVSNSSIEDTYTIYDPATNGEQPDGILQGTATFQDSYIQLTPLGGSDQGYYYYNKSMNGTGFIAEWDHWAGGGSGADGTAFWAYADQLAGNEENNQNRDGINFNIDEYQGSLKISAPYDDQVTTSPSFNIDSGTWRTVRNTYDGSTAEFIVNGNTELTHSVTDQSFEDTDNLLGWVGRTGGQDNYHRIRNLKVRKYQGSGNQPTASIGEKEEQGSGSLGDATRGETNYSSGGDNPPSIGAVETSEWKLNSPVGIYANASSSNSLSAEYKVDKDGRTFVDWTGMGTGTSYDFVREEAFTPDSETNYTVSVNVSDTNGNWNVSETEYNLSTDRGKISGEVVKTVTDISDGTNWIEYDFSDYGDQPGEVLWGIEAKDGVVTERSQARLLTHPEPEVSLDDPENNSANVAPFSFQATPMCYSNSCESVEFWVTKVTFADRFTQTDTTSEWEEGTVRNATISNGALIPENETSQYVSKNFTYEEWQRLKQEVDVSASMAEGANYSIEFTNGQGYKDSLLDLRGRDFDSRESVAETKTLRYRINFSGENISQSSISSVNISHRSRQSSWERIQKDGTVSNNTQTSYYEEFKWTNEFPIRIDWNAKITQSNGQSVFRSENYTVDASNSTEFFVEVDEGLSYSGRVYNFNKFLRDLGISTTSKDDIFTFRKFAYDVAPEQMRAVADQISFFHEPRIAIGEALNVREDMVRSFVGERGVQSPVNTRDTLDVVVSYPRSVDADQLTVGDELQVILNKVEFIPGQGTSVDDSVDRSQGVFRRPIVQGSVADAVADRILTMNRDFAENTSTQTDVALGYFRDAAGSSQVRTAVVDTINRFRVVGEDTTSDTSVTRNIDVTRSFEDVPTVTDEVTRFLNSTREASDNTSVDDDVIKIEYALASDGLTSSDSVKRIVEFARFENDGSTITDRVTRGFEGVRTVEQITAARDSVTRVFAGDRNVSDNTNVSDDIIKEEYRFEDIGTRIEDSVDAVALFNREQYDSSSIEDVVTRSVQVSRSFAEITALADTVDREFIGDRNASDIVSVDAVSDAVVENIRPEADGVLSDDSVIRVYNPVRKPGASTTLADDIVRSFTGERPINQPTSVADVLDREFTGQRNASENTSIADDVITIQRGLVSQQTNVDDSVDRVIQFIRNQDESTDTNTTVTRSIGVERYVREDVPAVMESTRQIVGNRVTGSISTTVGEDVISYNVYERFLNDTENLQVREDVVAITEHIRTPEDTVDTAVSVTRSFEGVREQVERVTANESDVILGFQSQIEDNPQFSATMNTSMLIQERFTDAVNYETGIDSFLDMVGDAFITEAIYDQSVEPQVTVEKSFDLSLNYTQTVYQRFAAGQNIITGQFAGSGTSIIKYRNGQLIYEPMFLDQGLGDYLGETYEARTTQVHLGLLIAAAIVLYLAKKWRDRKRFIEVYRAKEAGELSREERKKAEQYMRKEARLDED